MAQVMFHGVNMAYYAFLDSNNVVTEVISGKDEGQGTDWEAHYGNFRGKTCKRTSYNTHQNKHNDGKTAFRGNYASIGSIYYPDLDIFMPPKPFNSWTMATANASWVCPIEEPDDNQLHRWDEENQQWISYT